MGEQMYLNGIDLQQVTTIGDNTDHLHQAIRSALERVRFIFLTGGLGPTSDDLTKPALCSFFEVPLIFHPGVQWASGPCVDVQEFLVELISVVPYAEYVQAHILDPLKLSKTRYYLPEEDRSKFAAWYSKDKDGNLNRISDEDASSFNTNHWPLTPGGYGLTSTLDDYMRFARMLVHKG